MMMLVDYNYLSSAPAVSCIQNLVLICIVVARKFEVDCELNNVNTSVNIYIISYVTAYKAGTYLDIISGYTWKRQLHN